MYYNNVGWTTALLYMFIEIWKPVPGYEEKYAVSNLGNVKSLNYHREHREKIMKPQVAREGYLHILLTKNGKQKWYYIHRLVWSAFNGNIPSGVFINHINEDKTDNRLENLNLMTAKENCNWGTRNERMASKLKIIPRSKNGGASKCIIQYDLDGNFIKEWPSSAEITRQLGFGNTTTAVCRGERKSAYGYIWKFKERSF